MWKVGRGEGGNLVGRFVEGGEKGRECGKVNGGERVCY